MKTTPITYTYQWFMVNLSERLGSSEFPDFELEQLFARVRAEAGRLDVLVNDIWGGDVLAEWGTPFWELAIAQGQQMLERAVHSHIITSRHGAPLMIERDAGLTRVVARLEKGY